MNMSDKISNSVLLVEDSPIYERIITGHLRNWGFEVTLAQDGEEAWEILQQPNSPRLVVMDWVMPKMDGVELCRRLRKLPSAFPYTYTLLLTGKDSRADLLKAMEAGVDDYLSKPFDDLELKARLLAGKRVIDLQNQLLAARESLRYAASYDHLTGLMNRKEVMEALERELARAKRDRSPVTIAMIDVDHFKKVNDDLGHLFGDAALKEVARRFQSQLRVYDSIGRVGGEELLLVFPGCDLTSALIRMDQIRGLVCNKPVTAMGKSRIISVSIGIAVADGQKAANVNDLLHQADLGLYEAKRKGRNRVEHLESVTESDYLLAGAGR
jgi:diguanylate cyclase (GGDEF)-like protein